MAYINKLFEYSNQANTLIIEKFNNEQYQMKEPIELFSHILNAQHFWACRILNKPYKFGLFETHSLEKFKDIIEKNASDWEKIFEKFNNAQIIKYSSTSGKQYENTISDICFHVINHTTHHRAQICTIWRQNGLEPPRTDYIFFARTEL